TNFRATTCSRCRLLEEAGLEPLPPPGQGSPTRPVRLAAEAFPIQLLVASGPDIGVNGQPQCVGVDAEQVQVEQRVDVGPQEQPVRGVVVCLAAIGPDVCGLQQGQQGAAGGHTGVAVPLPQAAAEPVLAPPGLDGGQHPFTGVLVGQFVL